VAAKAKKPGPHTVSPDWEGDGAMAQYIPNRCTSVANVTTLPRLTLPAYEPAWIHCLCSASHTASPISDFCCALPPTAPEGPFSGCQGSYGHCLFISAFMLASKIICDNTYSNKSWCIVGQEMFAPQEIIITSWSRRCATWSGNSMLIPRHCAILLAQAPIH
jgi:hypothetical protein